MRSEPEVRRGAEKVKKICAVKTSVNLQLLLEVRTEIAGITHLVSEPYSRFFFKNAILLLSISYYQNHKQHLSSVMVGSSVSPLENHFPSMKSLFFFNLFTHFFVQIGMNTFLDERL